jgi:flagellar basal-body rod modification protein FlgD
MTADVTLTGVSQGMSNTQTQAIKLTNDFSDFLRLLTTQLMNQDPLNPMDSTEFTNQLVQFSQVEQAINTNQKLDDMLALQVSSISTVALGYVGLDITYTSAEMNWDGQTPISINYALPSEARVAKINIYDENENLVRSLDSPKSAGAHKVEWDGKDNNGNTVPAGTYSLRVDAADVNEKPITATTAVTGRVRGIESQNGVIFLLVGERAIALGNVIQAVQPQQAATPQGGDSGGDDEDSA